MKIEVRGMLAEDIPAIMAADEDMSDSFREYLERQFNNQKNGECSALIALCDGKVAGHVFLYYKCRWGACGNQGLPAIVDLKVFEKYRNKGVAGKLMDAAEAIAVQYNEKIYLDVCLNSEYGAAQRLYIKRGYVPDGKGVYYEEEVCPVDAPCANDDELTLCLIKQLIKSGK